MQVQTKKNTEVLVPTHRINQTNTYFQSSSQILSNLLNPVFPPLSRFLAHHLTVLHEVAINKNIPSYNLEMSQSKVKGPIHYKCFASVWRQFTCFNLQSHQSVDCILNSYWIIYMQVTCFVCWV